MKAINLFQPRDQYLTKLLKKLQVTDKEDPVSLEEAAGDTVETWETLDDEDHEVTFFSLPIVFRQKTV